MSEDVALFKTKNPEIKSVHQEIPGTEILIPRSRGIQKTLNENNSFRFDLIEYPDTYGSIKGVQVISSLDDHSRNVSPVGIANVSEKVNVSYLDSNYLH